MPVKGEGSCPSQSLTILFPPVFPAVALGWPDSRITFKQLALLALNKTAGWGSVGAEYAQWGRFRMGHGHPGTPGTNSGSNSGRLFVASAVYAFTNLTSSVLTPDVVNSTAAVEGGGLCDV